ncbi:hypothetical protein [Kitasatospora sp. NPDC047058]|uniref:hypothetical protein n=1 Tax=Kitasatospora sp. NPDC047058 TaxID=3155620 RepID=UPI003411CECE
MQNRHADWETWLSCYQQAVSSRPDRIEEECPNCGSRSLELVFIGPLGLGAGAANFWCGTCLTGIVISRCPVPEGARFIPSDQPRNGNSGRPPNFVLVVPE